MPAIRLKASPTPSSSKSSLIPSSSTRSSTTHRRRKGVPYKSPARTTTQSTSASPLSSTSSTPINPSSSSHPTPQLLLRLLLSRPASELDNKRYKPPPTSSPAHQQKVIKKVLGQRDRLEPAQEGFGRGRRTARAALSADYVDLSQGFPGTTTARGRSPAVKGKATAVVAGNGRTGAGAAANARRAYAGNDYLPVASTSSSHYGHNAPASTGRMSRAVSANGAHLSPSYAAPIPSPLARSFSASGIEMDERDARSRAPSAAAMSGAQRLADLGGRFDYSAPTGFVAA
ncbi:hypothetical protein JCM11641_008135 [Rhodosporidiobolus odoratus]